MNEKINLCEILKDAPKGTKLWTTTWGQVKFIRISTGTDYPIEIENDEDYYTLTEYGCFCAEYDDSECILFPSKEQRDWSKFVLPKTNVKVTLHPFDRVLVRDKDGDWRADILAHIFISQYFPNDYYTVGEIKYSECVPYNADTANLLETDDDCQIDYDIEFDKSYREV